MTNRPSVSKVPRKATTGLVALLLCATSVALLPPAQATHPPAWVGYGFPLDHLGAFEADSDHLDLDYTSFWAVWEHGEFDNWDDVTKKTRQAISNGTVPVVYWYYWGDRIRQSCVEQGKKADGTSCNRSKAEWELYTEELAAALDAGMGTGDQAIVILENEFHKADIDDPDYAPTFDLYMKARIQELHAAPGVKVVVGFGPWATGRYHLFNDAVAESDMLGSMILYSAAHPGGSNPDWPDPNDACWEREYGDQPYDYLAGVGFLKTSVDTLWDLYGPGGTDDGPDKHRTIVYDVGLSSWTDTDGNAACDYEAGGYTTSEQETDGEGWENYQELIVRHMYANLTYFRDRGVEGWVYRAYIDDANKGVGNFHFYAERWFGFKQHSNYGSTVKDARDDVFGQIEAQNAVRDGVAPPPPTGGGGTTPTIPGNLEAESFATRPAGGQYANAAFSGGAGWALYTNGGIEQTFDVTSTATYRVEVAALGEAAGGASPQMQLLVDGVVKQTWTVGATLATHAVDVSIPAGARTVRVAFTNDYYAADGDRNLYVDVLRATSLAPAAPGLFEAESFENKPVGGIYPGSGTNASWSGGKGWNIWSNGAISHTVNVPQNATFVLEIAGKGDLAGSALPHMELWAGSTLLGAWDVGGSYAKHTVTRTLAAGNTVFSVKFTNDYNSGGQDRNLKVDYLRITQAQPTVPGSFEAEDFTRRPTGGLETEAGWSGGEGWELWSNGGIEQDVFVGQTQTYRVTIHAAGDLAGPAYPHMVLKVDGATRAEWDVTTETLREYVVETTLNAGDHVLRLEFTNDYNVNGQDRDLKVDVVHVTLPRTVEWTQEAEALTTWTAGGELTDPDDSGGSHWNLWSNGTGTTTMGTTASGAHALEIRARGHSMNGVWPNMLVYVDNVLVATIPVDSDAYEAYVVSLTLAAGSHALKVEFNNDDRSSTEDRNLLLDVFTLKRA